MSTDDSRDRTESGESLSAGRSAPRPEERVSITTGTITDSYVVLNRRVLIPATAADAPED